MRLFIALDIDDAIRQSIHVFMDGVRGFASDARWVRPESLHVTLKFIGEKPAEDVEKIQQVLSSVQARALDITFRRYGFFPTTKAPRVFWLGVEAGPELAKLADAVDTSTASLGIPKEDHAFSPHLTLARSGRSGASFKRLQEKLAALPAPEFGTMMAHEFFLFQSQPMRGGSRYTKLARFALH
jgi:RNA 2',3'-cyclic 3'-phosphodiesterase